MQYKLLTGLIMGALSSSVCFGSGLIINQSGDNSSSTVQVNQSNSDLSQINSGPYAEVNQLGGALSTAKIDQLETDASLARITQAGDNQHSDIVQRNVTNALANTHQTGSDNQATILQEATDISGSSNTFADVNQTGQANTAKISQLDSTNVNASINQTGNSNSADLAQYGSNHIMDVAQNGTSNSVTICQGNDAACN